MPRKREQLRIANRRRELTNARRRFNTAVNKSTAGLNQFETQAAIQKQIRTRAAVEIARGKLVVALQAPTRAKARDISKRPGRYKNVKKARAANTKETKKVDRRIKSLRVARLTGREGNAERLVAEAIRNGRSAEEAFRDIAKRTGVLPAVVFSMFIYATPDNPNPV